MNRENETTEYKLLTPDGKLADSFLKCTAAFLNTDGGTIYLGIADDGTVVGVADPDDVQKRISSLLRDSLRPEMLPFLVLHGKLGYRQNMTSLRISWRCHARNVKEGKATFHAASSL